MEYTYKCKCGALKTVIFAKGPCKECKTDAIYRIDKE